MKKASLLPKTERKDAFFPGMYNFRHIRYFFEKYRCTRKNVSKRKKVVAYFEKMYIIIFVPVGETSW